MRRRGAGDRGRVAVSGRGAGDRDGAAVSRRGAWGPPPSSNIASPRRATVSPRGPFQRLRHAGAVALLVLAAACGGEPTDGIVGPDRPGGTGTTGGSGGSSGGGVESRLVGAWSHILYFYDDFGDFRSSQTVWSFSADGVAVRTVYARNETWGTSDAVVAIARWRIDAGDVEITWQPPFTGSVRYAYRLESSATYGDVLYLAGTPFVPVAR